MRLMRLMVLGQTLGEIPVTATTTEAIVAAAVKHDLTVSVGDGMIALGNPYHAPAGSQSGGQFTSREKAAMGAATAAVKAAELAWSSGYPIDHGEARSRHVEAAQLHSAMTRSAKTSDADTEKHERAVAAHRVADEAHRRAAGDAGRQGRAAAAALEASRLAQQATLRAFNSKGT